MCIADCGQCSFDWLTNSIPIRLAAIREIHTAFGKHKVEAIPFPEWFRPTECQRPRNSQSIKAATVLSDPARTTRLPSDILGTPDSGSVETRLRPRLLATTRHGFALYR